jgi:hypothetical protein
MWRRREIESYLCTPEVLLTYARSLGTRQVGELVAITFEESMKSAIDEVGHALKTLGKGEPFGPDVKASDDFLDPLFRNFFSRLGLDEATMRKTDYHKLAPFLAKDAIDPEIVDKLARIVAVARLAYPAKGDG